MRRKEKGAALLASLAAILQAGAACAYCRTSVCPGVGTSQVCTPPEPGDCGLPLFWPKPCVGWSLHETASRDVTFAEAEQALRAAFDTWMSADCAGQGPPRIKLIELSPSKCGEHEYNKNAGNTNVVLFRDEEWPYDGSQLALTTVTYNLDTGAIYDADMELNSRYNHFTFGDSGVESDLLSVVTHEAGHFLGLAHTSDGGAVMSPGYIPQTTSQRHLSADDIAGICAIYRPGVIPADCDPTPRHGFSPLCANSPAPGAGRPGSAGGCAVMPGRAPRGGVAAGAVLGALTLAARRLSARAKGQPR